MSASELHGRRERERVPTGPSQTYRITVRAVDRANADGASRQDIIRACRPEESVELVRELDNRLDSYAIVVETVAGRIGRIGGEHSEWLAERIDSGRVISAKIRGIEPTPGAPGVIGVVLAVKVLTT